MPRIHHFSALGWLAAVMAVGWLRAADSNRWAYTPLRQVEPPQLNAPSGLRNSIDAFIRARLQQDTLAPAPEANRRTLLRRVYFDLIGLPPTPEEFREFLADPSKEAYEHAVDHLLSSPRYGERRARHWMDAAHFAETHGNDQDRIRTNAWPYRDYLITSFNNDKPYTRFIQEQVAGDALFPDDPQATVALGFIAAGPWDESSLRCIREDSIDRQIGRYLDRDDMVTTVMSVVTSSTVQCARCHDHKFDPIPQRDYYALQSVFAGVDRANRTFDSNPAVHVKRQELRQIQRRVEKKDAALLMAADSQREVAEWEHRQTATHINWIFVDPQTFVSVGGATLTKQPDHSVLASGARPDKDTYTISAPAPSSAVTAFRLEVLTHDSLPHGGPGRADNGNLHLSEIQLLAFEPGAAQPRDVPLANPTADFNQQDWTIEHALDKNEKSAWGIHPREGSPHQAVFELKEPLTLPPGATLVFVLKQLHGEGHIIGRPRLAITGDKPPIRASTLPAEVDEALAMDAAKRTDSQRLTLAGHVLGERLRNQIAALPAPSLIYAAASDYEPDGGLKPSESPRMVQVLRRGEITKPIEIASPGALSCIGSLPARFDLAKPDDEGARRAALAKWLTSRDNPLTWRSIVNRVWAQHFGRGLVSTPNDFGQMGDTPSHPELLDWLAVWFRDEAKGSFKELDRLLVTSATYRQSVAASPASDPDNRLLSHMNRTRLDAECVRDAILEFSGKLDLRMGGPSDLQFDLQPGIHVTPKVDYSKFDVDSPAGARRSVYRFLFRTLPDPFMEALDCPAGDQLTAARNNTVTVQQALALWNNAFVARQAQHFAERLESTHSPPEEQISRACEWVWGRPARPDEVRDLAAYAADHGLASACRLLLNSNEFIFVN
jgi:hypothetical protein